MEMNTLNNNGMTFNFDTVEVPQALNGITELRLARTENLRTIEYVDKTTGELTHAQVIDFVFVTTTDKPITIQIFIESLPIFFKRCQKAFNTNKTGNELIQILSSATHKFYVEEIMKDSYFNYNIDWSKTLKHALIK